MTIYSRWCDTVTFSYINMPIILDLIFEEFLLMSLLFTLKFIGSVKQKVLENYIVLYR